MRNRTGKNIKNAFKDSSVRAGLAFISIFVLLSSLVGAYYERHGEGANVHQQEATSSPDSYRSLDLSVAKQATYTNTALRIVRDVGVKNKTHIQLINFDVPKDGLNEYGLMTTPIGRTPKGGWPVLILCHAYSRPSNYSTLKANLADMEFYSSHGFSVIKPDFRGQGYSKGHGNSDGAFYSMGYNTDVMSLIASIKQTNYLNSNNINIWGHSMGGYVALRAAVLSPDIKTAILLAAPVGTSKDMFKLYTPISDTDNIAARNIRKDQLAHFGTPLSNPSFWDKASPLNYLGNMRAYVMIYVGRQDRVVPYKFSQDLDTALANLHKAHSYTIYSPGAHGLWPQRQLIWQSSLKQLEQVKNQP